MKPIVTIFLICCSFFSYSQENLSRKQKRDHYYNQGIEAFEKAEFARAFELFVEAKHSGQKHNDIYYYIAASAYNSKQPSSIVLQYSKLGVLHNSHKSIFFYSSTLPLYIEEIDNELFSLVTASPQEWAFYNFCKANCLAKRKQTNAFIYFEEALKDGYSIPSLSKNYPIKKLNESLYFELLEKYDYKYYDFLIKEYVEARTLEWQKKGKFEKTIDFKNRVTELNRSIKVKEFVQEFIDSVGMSKFDFTHLKNNYDADNEVFKILFENNKAIFVHVPINEAKSFYKNFKSLQFENPIFTLGHNVFDLMHLEIENKENNKTYVYDSQNALVYNSENLNIKLSAIELDIEESVGYSIQTNKKISIDVDEEIPETGIVNPNKFALIIGNEDYTSFQSGLSVEQNVAFAKHDAVVFKEYCIKTLGIPSDNIIFKTNAGVVQMHQGINQMNSIIKNMEGKAEIVFYYAGHGFPDYESKTPYLVPIDVSSATLDMGISLHTLINKLTEYPSKSAVMFLDACFTGGGRDMGLLASRGVKVVPNETKLKGNLVMFSASSIDQSALPYVQKSHGLFTYFLLKKLKQSKGEATFSELDEYLKKQVSIKSTIMHSQEQNPATFYSQQIKEDWKNMLLR